VPELADDVTEMASRVFDRPEFRHYAGYQDQLLLRLINSHLQEIESKTAVSRAELTSAQEITANLQRVKGIRAKVRAFVLGGIAGLTLTGWVFLMAVPLATITRWLEVNPADSWISRNIGDLVVWLVVASIVFALSCVAQVARRAAVLKALLLPVEAARGLYRRTLESAVQEAISTAINDELGPKGIVAFPTHAPRLVELDSSQITPSRTTEYVREFILEHEASAIGLAGTRGSGKSTVMRALRADLSLGLVTIVPSPVRYDPGEFVRLLLAEVAVAIAGYPAANGPVLWMRKLAAVRWSTLMAVIAFGGLLVIFSPTRTSWVIDFPDPVTVIGLLVLAAASFIVWLRFMIRMGGLSQSDDVRLARELLRDLKWETERGMTAKSTLKLQSFFESGGESSIKLKRRAYTRSDVVAELRKLLALFANSQKRDRLVVCIDELDKIDTVEHLVEIVNELKDLFHVQKLHFLVAVSTDALKSFEKRGLSSRDAFDSAFDTIVHTDRLTLRESLAVVTSRATGFAPLIAMFCHAWSGGLARDLLRAARALVEQQRRSTQGPLSMVQLIEHLVCTDLEAAIRASIQTLEPDDAQIAALWQLHQSVEQSRTDYGAVVIAADAMTSLAFDTPILQALHAKARLGMSLLRLAHAAQSLPTYWDDNSRAIQNLEIRLSEHAVAVSEVDAPQPMRDAAMGTAIRAFDPAIFNGHGVVTV